MGSEVGEGGEGQGTKEERDKKGRKEGRSYHDITPLVCCYIFEWCSFSLMLGVVQGSQIGGGRGVWSIRVLEVELLDHSWGMDFSMGEPHVI